jgi:hypothetical protein
MGLYCNGDSLGSINLKNNTSLQSLELSGCNLSSLDVTANANLMYLTVNNNPIGTLDLTKQTILEILDCNNCSLDSLNLLASGAHLKTLICSDNKLTKLDLSKSTSLSALNCINNNLVALDLSACTNLTTSLSADGSTNEVEVNSAGQFDLTKLSAFGFDPTKASAWTGGTVDGTTFTFTNVNANATYDYDCGGNHTVTFTLVPKVRTAAPLIGGSEVKAFATGNVVNILGTDAKAQVFDAAGRTVYAGADRQITIGTNGLYLVKVAGKTFKVVIR